MVDPRDDVGDAFLSLAFYSLGFANLSVCNRLEKIFCIKN